MDQNFSLMAQSRANYYTAGSPVQFVRVELLKGDVTGEVAVCLTFKNVGTEPLTGFIIHFKCKDASGQILCEDDFYYEQLNVQPGELFGADDAVFVSDTPVSSVEIEQDRAFLNGRGVDLRNYKRVRLQAPRVLPGSIARTLQTRTNNKMLTCVPQDTENGWFCACGAFHPNEVIDHVHTPQRRTHTSFIIKRTQRDVHIGLFGKGCLVNSWLQKHTVRFPKFGQVTDQIAAKKTSSTSH